MSYVDEWNARASWCLAHAHEHEERARRRLARWKHLEAMCPSRELLAAAHPPGLLPGEPKDLIEKHEDGCLVMASDVGDGKTTAAAWRCYTSTGSVLWLDAARVALARTEDMESLLARIPAEGLVVLDDVGAAGTTGKWEAPKVAVVLTTIAARRGPSVVTTNLSREVFGEVYDGGQGGRLIDRLEQRPNRFATLKPTERSRRATAEPPPTGLPPRELAAASFLRAVDACRRAEQAQVRADVDERAVLEVARLLGASDVPSLDQRVREHDRLRREADEAIARLFGKFTSWSLDDPAEAARERARHR